MVGVVVPQNHSPACVVRGIDRESSLYVIRNTEFSRLLRVSQWNTDYGFRGLWFILQRYPHNINVRSKQCYNFKFIVTVVKLHITTIDFWFQINTTTRTFNNSNNNHLIISLHYQEFDRLWKSDVTITIMSNLTNYALTKYSMNISCKMYLWSTKTKSCQTRNSLVIQIMQHKRVIAPFSEWQES